MNISSLMFLLCVFPQQLQPGPKVGIVNNNAAIQPAPQTKMTVEQGRILQISVLDKGYDAVNWVRTGSDYDLIPSESSKSAYFCAPKTGKYVVIVYSALVKDGKPLPTEATRIEVTVAEQNNLPENPDNPVDPNTPVVDQFTKDVVAAFNKLTDPNKNEYKDKLIAAYRSCAASTANYSNSTGELYQMLGKNLDNQLPRIALKAVREVVGTELNNILSKDATVAVTPDAAKKAAVLFGKAADALSTIK